MAAETASEERFAALEAEVARLRPEREAQRPPARDRTSPDFPDAMIGMHAASPAFEEVTRRTEEGREREREEAGSLPTAEGAGASR